MTLNEFEKEVEEKLKFFIRDWEVARQHYGDGEFPVEMDITYWWNCFFAHDKDKPYSL
jgi:hypothetical protein